LTLGLPIAGARDERINFFGEWRHVEPSIFHGGNNLPAGVYAVSVFHDENMNQKLDKNFVGIPKEGYGASNNPRKKMGPPTFEETKIQVSGAEQSLQIKLMY
jgi:uncharacterized protein (DUF2141 family)